MSPNVVYDMDRRHTKTPSIAPSESASQVPKARREREREPSVKPARSEVEPRSRSGGSRGEQSRVEGEHVRLDLVCLVVSGC